MQIIRLTPKVLSTRWGVPLATLSQWRWNGKGPTFMKLGRHILYRPEDVEYFEEKKLRQNTICTMLEFMSHELQENIGGKI